MNWGPCTIFALAWGLTLGVPLTATADAPARGQEGQTLSASKTTGLATDGEEVAVTGHGYNISKGIYLVVCVDKGAGRQATPCMGGVDTQGSSGSSAWISSNPPDYGKDLAKPYTDEGNGKGGFQVTIKVKAKDDVTNCTASGVRCVIYTRADHTRSSDRTQDVRLPISFGSGGAGTSPSSAATSPQPQAPATTLPNTGVEDTFPMWVAGIALVAGGYTILIISRHLRDRRPSRLRRHTAAESGAPEHRNPQEIGRA